MGRQWVEACKDCVLCWPPLGTRDFSWHPKRWNTKILDLDLYWFIFNKILRKSSSAGRGGSIIELSSSWLNSLLYTTCTTYYSVTKGVPFAAIFFDHAVRSISLIYLCILWYSNMSWPLASSYTVIFDADSHRLSGSKAMIQSAASTASLPTQIAFWKRYKI